MMNDTFDDFTLANITSIGTQSTNLSKIEPKNCDRINESAAKIKNDVSFDDSLFLNSQEFNILKNIENVLDIKNKPLDEKTIISSDENVANSENQSNLSDFFDSPSLEGESKITDISSSKSVDIFDNTKCDDDLFNESTQSTKSIKENTDSKLELAAWGLPEAILEKYASRNITVMFPWQVECLNNPKILKEHANLVYSAPTSAGKTLVAEILAVKTVLERSKKVIFILPFVSVVREKMFYFQDIFSGSGVRVEGFMGSYNPPGGFKKVQFAVCTIEKANSLINNFLQEGTLKDIGTVIIDEMHLIGEPNRGYLLELLLTKLRYISKKVPEINIQVVGMSATLPNLKLLAQWLDAQLYVTNFRPIPLYEEASIGGDIYDANFKLVRKVLPLTELDTDTDNILQLCLETINNNCSVLIFCPTKNWCENLAQQIAVAFWKLGSGKSELGQQLRNQLSAELITEVLEQLKRCPVGLDHILRKTVSFGVAFHHAGLTLDERDIIEGAFRNSVVRVLVATSTLSSGVNLPARRVIIRTPIFHGKPLDSLTYRQMIGRAGRMGKDTQGESILICQKSDEKIAMNLMQAELKCIESCLEGDGKLKRAILEIIASGVASTPEDVDLFTKCTLLAQNEVFDNPIQNALDFLITNEFIRLQDDDEGRKYVASSLGRACLSSSIPPEDGLSLFTELEKARQCFVLETELHLIYLVTPYSACHQWGTIDWMFYLNLWEKLPKSMKRVGELVGVRESYLVSATRGKVQTNTSKLYHKYMVHKRFFVALALQDLVNEKPLSEVCSKFSCNRGMLQTLQLTASTFAGMVTSFSRQLGWSTVEILISQFQDRLHFGVSRDLLDLMRLPLLNGKCARALYNGGLETLIQIANSDINTIENILHKVTPFESEKMREGETESALKERNKMKNIWITGKEGLTEREAAELLLRSARDYLRIEMGLKEAKWDGTDSTEDLGTSCSSIEDKNNLDISSRKDRNTSDTSLFENSISGDNPSKFSSILNVSRTSLNSSGGDFIVTSQDDSYASFVEKSKSSKKRKKRGKENKLILLEQSPRKKKKISLDFLEEIEMVDVCKHDELFDTFWREARTQQMISIAVACSEIEEKKRYIGLTPEDISTEKFSCKNRRVEGLAVFWGGQTTFYVDLTKLRKSLDFIKMITNNKEVTIVMFDSKEQIKVLKKCCKVDFEAKIEDPKIGDWLLDPEGREKTLQSMVNVYSPHLSKISLMCGISKNTGSPSLDIQNPVDRKIRSCLESLISFHVARSIKEELIKENPILLKVYVTEMSCLRTVARMELTGVGVSKTALSKLVQTLNQEQMSLERKAYTLAGRHFSFASTKAVAKILGMYKGQKVSTKKQVLEKNENPISDLVLQWRKINCTVTKMIQPLIRSVENGRIHGCCILHTSTGRISMHEPNLQNVTKNFNVHGQEISCRDAFIPRNDHVLVSADYCQLELRLLAHLSQDELLCKIMREEGDVFRSVAAKWNRIKESEVTDTLRQHAKQICYGIIYGMGSKALSEQLAIDEQEATVFMERFKNTYPGVKHYIKEVIAKCEKNGYVETLAGRRRYLPNINHKNGVVKGQAERQAVNTTIQGSAADVVKNTMVVLEQKCLNMKEQPHLVLHLHDELLYEVPKLSLKNFISILKNTMEESVKLSVPFPVKVKTGPSWGQLTECNL